MFGLYLATVAAGWCKCGKSILCLSSKTVVQYCLEHTNHFITLCTCDTALCCWHAYLYTYICLPASAATWPLWLKHRSVASSSLMQSCAQGKFVLLLPQNISLDVALSLLIVMYLIGVLVNQHCRVHSHSYHTAVPHWWLILQCLWACYCICAWRHLSAANIITPVQIFKLMIWTSPWC